MLKINIFRINNLSILFLSLTFSNANSMQSLIKNSSNKLVNFRNQARNYTIKDLLKKEKQAQKTLTYFNELMKITRIIEESPELAKYLDKKKLRYFPKILIDKNSKEESKK